MKEGDWVRVRFMHHTYFGYANKVHDDQDAFEMYIVKQVDSDGNKYDFHEKYKMLYRSQAEPVETEYSADDYVAMIDLALMTGDREWFNELVEKASLKKEKPFEDQQHRIIAQGLRNINKTIADGFTALGRSLANAFSFFKKQLMQAVQIIVNEVDEIVEKNRERAKMGFDCLKGLRTKQETRQQSQVLENNPKSLFAN